MEEEFHQRVYASPVNLFVPDFFSKTFNPDYVPDSEMEVPGHGEVFFPATPDEFDQMLAEFEAQDAALQQKQTWDALQ